MTKLEVRLAETEAALFRTLCLLNGTPDSSHELPQLDKTSTSSRQSKTDRITEWERLPLKTSDDDQAWYHAKSSAQSLSSFDIGDTTSTRSAMEDTYSMIDSTSSPLEDPMRPINALMGPVQTPLQALPITGVSPQSTTSQMTAPHSSFTPPGPSKSEQLTKSQSSLYF